MGARDAAWAGAIRGYLGDTSEFTEFPSQAHTQPELGAERTLLHEIPLMALPVAALPLQQIPLRLSLNNAAAASFGAALRNTGGLFAVVEEKKPPASLRHAYATVFKVVRAGAGGRRLLNVGLVRAQLLAVSYQDGVYSAELRTCCDAQAGPPPPWRHTAHSRWVWRLLDARHLAARLAKLSALRVLSPLSPQELTRSKSPAQLSFWAANHLALDARQRARLLSAPHTAARLRLLLRYAQGDTLRCASCGSRWGQSCDAVRVDELDDGETSYVNAHGWVHSLFTLRRVDDGQLLLHGAPATEDSWFEGYAWTVASCRACSAFAGWRFTAAAPAAGTEFYGLRLGSFEQRCDAAGPNSSDDEEEQQGTSDSDSDAPNSLAWPGVDHLLQ